MNKHLLSTASRLMLFAAGALLVISIFVPLWRIELSAPQYPEGLVMKIFTYKLGGDVEIINGLNHYIGMQTLHAENFIEFTVLPYIIGFFALFTFITALVSRKRMLYILMISFILFGILAMVDFWRWEYNYGHNLDPNAAIIVPGMAYQPPLIGYKELLNFGAYSIPDIGGWLFVLSGLLMLLSVAKEAGWLDRFLKKKDSMAIILPAILFFSSCSPQGPESILWNKDQCHECKMTLTDQRFGTELITEKGRVYKFDDLYCMIQYAKAHTDIPVRTFYVCHYLSEGELIDAASCKYVFSREFRSPMRGDIAAFANTSDAASYAEKYGAAVLSWEEVFGKE